VTGQEAEKILVGSTTQLEKMWLKKERKKERERERERNVVA
jgi:hypothetical protein